MRLVIFGKTGQVGAELARYPFPSDVSVLHFGREDCDVEDFRMTALAIRHSGADVLINATGYSDAVKAESERERARALNANVPRGMAKAASELPNCPIIQLSTADVYAPGASGPLTEDSDVDPQSTFARTKEAGERAVMRAHEQHIILRPGNPRRTRTHLAPAPCPRARARLRIRKVVVNFIANQEHVLPPA